MSIDTKVLTGGCRPVAPAEVIGIAGRDDGQITPGEVGPVVDGGGHATIWEAHDRGTGACSLESPKVKKVEVDTNDGWSLFFCLIDIYLAFFLFQKCTMEMEV